MASALLRPRSPRLQGSSAPILEDSFLVNLEETLDSTLTLAIFILGIRSALRLCHRKAEVYRGRYDAGGGWLDRRVSPRALARAGERVPAMIRPPRGGFGTPEVTALRAAKEQLSQMYLVPSRVTRAQALR